jgi:hypothetical protein
MDSALPSFLLKSKSTSQEKIKAGTNDLAKNNITLVRPLVKREIEELHPQAQVDRSHVA